MPGERPDPTVINQVPDMNGEVARFADGSRAQVFNTRGETVGAVNKYYPRDTDSVNSAILRLASPDGTIKRVGINRGIAVMIPSMDGGKISFGESPTYKDLAVEGVPDTVIGQPSDIFEGDPVYGELTVDSVLLKYEGGNPGEMQLAGENPFPQLESATEAIREQS